MNNNFDKSSIIKSFEFSAEGITLTLFIRKIIYEGILKMFIDADVVVNNSEVLKHNSENGSSIYTNLTYNQSSFFWIGTNKWKGLRWGSFKNETGFAYYRDLKEMKEKYIEQHKFISEISDYFYDSIKQYKKLKMLYETEIESIIEE